MKNTLFHIYGLVTKSQFTIPHRPIPLPKQLRDEIVEPRAEEDKVSGLFLSMMQGSQYCTAVLDTSLCSSEAIASLK